ncbi:esterase/lipase [Oikeobacillus pervagus]|uniref:Esterase/lipase n=1 Tax=Oikeobacillus pervagus TaxID=1325931 RepID=A0AAJ1T476_9BACI|nr:alpha/beta fold hydrolase [Oikeobacillus pervagus]MDQ0216311.1 esterase/lipase [Oikeobacillus pervagus]
MLKQCEEVYVIGFSMGGLIAAYLATHYPVRKLVLLSAAAQYINTKQLLVDIREMVKDFQKGSLQENELFRRYRTKFTLTPISATIEFRKVVTEVRPLLKQITIPTLIAQGLADGIVPPKSAEYLYKRIPSREKQLIYFADAKHHICYTENREVLFRKVFSFLQKTKERHETGH